MVTNQLAIQGVSGTLAVGSLCFLGLFMIVDGATGLYVLVNQYAADPAWAVLFSFPALVLSYVFGLLATSGGHWLWSRLRAVTPDRESDLFVRMASLNNAAVVDRYQALVQHQVMLDGASIGFACLAVGALTAIRWLGPWSTFGWLSALGFGILAVLCPCAGAWLGKEVEALVQTSERVLVLASPDRGVPPATATEEGSNRG